MARRPIAFINARLVDPESGYDGPGCLLVKDGVVAEVIHKKTLAGSIGDAEMIDCGGHMLAPGLVDIRVKTGEPGAEPKETLKSAARAAAARRLCRAKTLSSPSSSRIAMASRRPYSRLVAGV